MKYKHANRPGFLLGFTDFFTAGLFFHFYMPRGLQDELEEILGHRALFFVLLHDEKAGQNEAKNTENDHDVLLLRCYVN